MLNSSDKKQVITEMFSEFDKSKYSLFRIDYQAYNSNIILKQTKLHHK